AIAHNAIRHMDGEIAPVEDALTIALLSAGFRLLGGRVHCRLQRRYREAARVAIAVDLRNAYGPHLAGIGLEPLAAPVLPNDQIELRPLQRNALRLHAAPEQRPEFGFDLDGLGSEYRCTPL